MPSSSSLCVVCLELHDIQGVSTDSLPVVAALPTRVKANFAKSFGLHKTCHRRCSRTLRAFYGGLFTAGF